MQRVGARFQRHADLHRGRTDNRRAGDAGRDLLGLRVEYRYDEGAAAPEGNLTSVTRIGRTASDTRREEYRYTSGGTPLHAYNLAIAGKSYGHALNMQTREDLWADSQDEWELIVDSFEPGAT